MRISSDRGFVVHESEDQSTIVPGDVRKKSVSDLLAKFGQTVCQIAHKNKNRIPAAPLNGSRHVTTD
jgi:hypothetical protein